MNNSYGEQVNIDKNYVVNDIKTNKQLSVDRLNTIRSTLKLNNLHDFINM